MEKQRPLIGLLINEADRNYLSRALYYIQKEFFAVDMDVTVIPGVHIGDGAIIGANSVVAKDVPPYCVAGGNPCRVIRQRFDNELIAYLLQIKWWDWDAAKIFKNIEALCSGDLTKIKNIKD